MEIFLIPLLNKDSMYHVFSSQRLTPTVGNLSLYSVIVFFLVTNCYQKEKKMKQEQLEAFFQSNKNSKVTGVIALNWC